MITLVLLVAVCLGLSALGLIVDVGDVFIVPSEVLRSSIERHHQLVFNNFDEAMYISFSMEYRIIGACNKTVDLGFAVFTHEGPISTVYVDVKRADWAKLSVVHRIPASRNFIDAINATGVYANIGVFSIDPVDNSSLTLEVLSVVAEYLPQPEKIFIGDDLPIINRYCPNEVCEDPCRLLGTSSAVLLNYIGISKTDFEGPPIRLFCGIFSTEEHHNTLIKALKETWASKCTGFLVFSTITDPTIPSVSVPHIGEESYRNMWQKIRTIWKYVHKHYRNEYDYFLLGGDDVYVLTENLYAYLSSEEITVLRALNKGIYLGRTFVNPQTKTAFNSGGAGYLLDSVALETLVLNLDEPHCNPAEYTSEEDTFVAMCLNSSINSISPHNTSDSLNRQRFHHFAPGFYVTYRPQYDPETGEGLDWYARLDRHQRLLFECCSEQSVSFHNVYQDLMYSMHDYLFHCPTEEKLRYYRLYGENYYHIVEKNRIPQR